MEALKTKTTEEIALEKELAEIRESTRLAQEELKKAKKELKSLEASDKKPFYKNKVVQTAALVAGLAAGGYGVKKGGDAINWGVDDPNAAKLSQPYNPGEYQAEAAKVHKEIVDLQERTRIAREQANAQYHANGQALEAKTTASDITAAVVQKIEEAKKEVRDSLLAAEEKAEKTRAEQNEKLEKSLKNAKKSTAKNIELATEKAIKVAQEAAEKMKAEMKARSEAEKKIEEQQQKQLEEIKKHMMEVEARKSASKATPNIREADIAPVRTKTYQGGTPVNLYEGVKPIGGIPPENYGNRVSTYHGGTGSPYAAGTYGFQQNFPQKVSLDSLTLEKVDKVYQNNIDKWDAEAWSNVKEKKAASFINQKKFNNEKEEAEKAIQKYVQRIQKISGLEPEKKETVDDYIDRVLQYEASKGLEQLHNLQQ